MYGLIHQAIRGCVEEHHGHEVWESIQSGLPHTESIFTSMKAYDDEVTFSLVGAASLAVKPSSVGRAPVPPELNISISTGGRGSFSGSEARALAVEPTRL